MALFNFTIKDKPDLEEIAKNLQIALQKKTPYQMAPEEMFPGEMPIEGLQTVQEGISPEKAAALAQLETAGVGGGAIGKLLQTAFPQLAETGYGGFKDLKDFMKAQQETRKEADVKLSPIRESLRKYGQATDIIKARGGFDKMVGADDTTLIKGFASMILPGEAVMSDDITTIVQQSGLPGTVESYVQAFKGKGTLGPVQRAEIYRTMTDLANRAKLERGEVKSLFAGDIKLGGFDPSSIFRPPMSVEPYPIPAGMFGQTIPGRQYPTAPRDPVARKALKPGIYNTPKGPLKYLGNGKWEQL